MSPSVRRALVAALLAAACLLDASGAAQVSDDQRLKAATLTKFGQFVEWPEDLRTTRSTFDLCLSPGHPFGRLVEDLMADATIQGLPVHVRLVSTVDQLAGCQILYVGKPTGASRRVLARAAQLPILTVGDDPLLLQAGGIINLRLIDGRVRFDIDVGHANRVGLQLSSQLLRLAQRVVGAT